MIVKVKCQRCGLKFHATTEQLDHYFYCPTCQIMGNVNHLFKITSASA